jgi:D-ribose pyranose/furanose isomerase RbsD
MNHPTPSWKRHLARWLPALGHRNWIGIVDAAFPLQTATGIEMITTGMAHLTVLKEVLGAVGRADHVRPRVLLDAELDHISETHAPGIGLLRNKMAKLLGGQVVTSLPHEEILGKLDATGRLFRILLFKTTLTLPYTSVFLELDCGYWSDEAERNLRVSLSRKKP